MPDRYLVIDKEILPDVFDKVLEAKELLRSGRVKEITEATRKVGISRSTFYKYKDKVFPFSETEVGKKVILSFMLNHMQGVLSNVLQVISAKGGNILTINQEIPINEMASVNITIESAGLTETLEELTEELAGIIGVQKVYILAME
jgi:chorismate mutase